MICQLGAASCGGYCLLALVRFVHTGDDADDPALLFSLVPPPCQHDGESVDGQVREHGVSSVIFLPPSLLSSLPLTCVVCVSMSVSSFVHFRHGIGTERT